MNYLNYNIHNQLEEKLLALFDTGQKYEKYYKQSYFTVSKERLRPFSDEQIHFAAMGRLYTRHRQITQYSIF